MKIVIDAMGGDNAPFEIVKGAVLASEETKSQIILVGEAEKILNAIKDCGCDTLPKNVEVCNATQVVTTEDSANAVMREKKDSSLMVAMRMVQQGDGDVLISAGSTAALLTCSTLILKRIKGIRRAAIATVLPTVTDGNCLLLDSGANSECTAEFLMQFAYMGSYYYELMFNAKKPRVALLNIGTEEEKGTDLQHEAYALLTQAAKQGRINFVGNAEARDVCSGEIDVMVADGFSGNVLLKSMEGTASLITTLLKQMYMKNLKTKLGALAVKGEISELKRKMDYKEVGGAPLLGISKPVIKAHGSSDAKAVKSAIIQAEKLVKSDIESKIAENIDLMKVSD